MKPTENPKEVPYQDADPVELPENAFRELAEDEGYRPIMHPARDYPEVTPYSVGMGLLLAVIFSAAAAYLGLKVGQVFEAAIPIAIIAVGLSGALKRESPGPERHHPEYRSMFGSHRCRSHIHPARTLHSSGQVSGNHRQLPADISQLALRRHTRHTLLHSVPQILRKDMHGKYPFLRLLRPPRCLQAVSAKALPANTGKPAPSYLPRSSAVFTTILWKLSDGGPVSSTLMSPNGARLCREDQTRTQLQHWSRSARSGLYHRTELCVHHLRRLNLLYGGF